jgi:hypothetical protein
MNRTRHATSPLAWLRNRLTPGRRKKPCRRPPRYGRPLLEALEDRTLPAQFVDLGALRFAADSFQQNGNTYSASGTIQLGLAPTGGEAFTPLVDIQGAVSFTTGLPDPTFQLTDAEIDATAQESPDTILWQAQGPTTFSVQDLTGGGADLGGNGQMFQVSYANFTPNNLRFADPDGDTADAQVRLQGSLGFDQLPGLSVPVTGNTFVSLDQTGVNLTDFQGAAVTTPFSVYGLQINPTSTVIAYSSNDGSFSLSGGITVSTTKDSGLSGAAANLGTVAEPGLVLQNGVVSQVNFGVPDQFTLFGLPVQPQDLTFTFDSDLQEFVMYGTAALPVHGHGTSPLPGNFGTSDGPGVTIANGQVQSDTIVVDGDFTLGGVPWQASDARLQYQPNQHDYTLTGSISLPYLLFVTSNLGSDAQHPALTVKDGQVQVDGFSVAFNDVYLGAFVIDNLTLSYSGTDHDTAYKASFAMYFPGSYHVGGTVAFDDDGHLSGLGFAFSSPTGVEIGDTGIFINGLSGSVLNFNDPANVVVSGSITLTYGGKWSLPGGAKATFLKAVGGFTVNREMLVLNGNVYLGAYTDPFGNTQSSIAQGAGTVTLDWGKQEYKGDFSVSWADGLFKVHATFDIGHGGNDVYVRADADVDVPSIVPFIGGDTIAGVNFALEYHKDAPLSQDFAAAWVHVGVLFVDFDIGFKVDFTGHPSVIGNDAIDHIQTDQDNPQPQVYHYYGYFQVKDGQTYGTVQVNWPEVAGTQSVAVLPPGQTTPIDQGQFSSANGLALVPQLSSGTSRAVRLVGSSTDPDQPLPAGQYELILTSDHKFSSAPTFKGSLGYPKPTVAVTGLTPLGDGTVQVQLADTVDEAFKDQATVSLFADTNNSGYHGSPIPGLVNLPYQPNQKLTWNLAGLLPIEPGYYVYAVINDGKNVPVYSAYSASPVLPTPPLSGIVSDPKHGGAALSGVTVFLDNDHTGRFNPADDPYTPTGPTGFYAFYGLTPGTTYDVGVVVPAGYQLDGSSQNPQARTYNGAPLTANFRLDELAAISGTVFNDLQQDGHQDPGDVGLAGWQVSLDDGAEVIYTDANGHYVFHNVALNTTHTTTHTVSVVLQPGYYQTGPLPIPPGTYSATFRADDTYKVVSGADFGALPFSTISGNVLANRADSPAVAIDAGGGAAGAYRADQGYSGDSSTGSTTDAIDTSRVTDPAPQSVYQTYRYGKDFTYTLSGLTPGADYTVRLHFAEVFWTQPGQRVFNVAINGAPVLDQFDVYAAAGGKDVALTRSFTATADADGTIIVHFTALLDNAEVNGIEVQPYSAVRAIDAGGGVAGIYAADAGYSGTSSAGSTAAAIDTSRVTGAAPQSVYQTYRYGKDFTYTVSGLAPGAAYTVRLHFAETVFNQTDKRAFDVAVNGQTALSQFDVFGAAGGQDIAIIRSYGAIADAKGTITVHFKASVGDAEINAIEVLPYDATLAVAAGGEAAGVFVVANGGFSGSSITGSTGDAIDTTNIDNLAPQTIYQNYRYGKDFSYTFGGLSPGAAYTVRLQFAETVFGQPGQRVFDVAINGQTVLSQLDLVEAAGVDRALALSFAAAADGNGRVVIRFTAEVDNALVNAIELIPAAAPLQGWVVRLLQPVVQINAGGGSYGSFQADKDFNGGDTFYNSQPIDTSGVNGPAPQYVYQTLRYGPAFSYTVPGLRPHATYAVRLDFADNYYDQPGQRLFNVTINGQQMLTDYDIARAAGGRDRAAAVTLLTTASAHGAITIQFTAVKDNALVNGIEISQVVATATTDADGNYSFGGLRAGTYTVAEDVQAGWRQVSPSVANLDLQTPGQNDVYAVDGNPTAVAVGDFDGGGKADDFAVVAPLKGDDSVYAVYVFFNGQLGSPTLFYLKSPAGGVPLKVVAADISGNGRQDLAVVFDTGYVDLLVNQGDGNFVQMSEFWQLPGFFQLDGVAGGRFFDGAPGEDLAVVYADQFGNNQLLILSADGNGNAQEASTALPSGDALGNLAVADFNGDGHLDVVIADDTNASSTPLLGYGDGNGGFIFQALTGLPAGTTVVVGDLNGDGLPDIGLFGHDGLFHYALLARNGLFSATTAQLAVPETPADAFFADMNGDLRPDLVWVSYGAGGPTLSVALNAGAGTLFAGPAQTTALAPAGPGGLAAAAAVLNGDGLPDVVVADQSAGLAEVVYNRTAVGPSSISVTVDGTDSADNTFVNARAGQVP